MKIEIAFLFRIAAELLLAMGSAIFGYLYLLSPDGALRTLIRDYETRLHNDLRFLQSRLKPQNIVIAQSVAALFSSSTAVLCQEWLLILFLPFIFFLPKFWLRKKRLRRTTRIEEQLDSWLLSLANALKSGGSLGEAISSSALLIQAPISQEIDLLIKENKLGAALDQAMQNMSERIGSRSVSSALLLLRIARNTGGDLPRTLETAAAGLREISRLEGVVRTKTAEGKAQLVVIASIFPILVGALNWMDPRFLHPLAATFTGHLVIAGAVSLWLAAIFIARQVLNVDI